MACKANVVGLCEIIIRRLSDRIGHDVKRKANDRYIKTVKNMQQKLHVDHTGRENEIW